MLFMAAIVAGSIGLGAAADAANAAEGQVQAGAQEDKGEWAPVPFDRDRRCCGLRGRVRGGECRR